jgi:hypothetical protein
MAKIERKSSRVGDLMAVRVRALRMFWKIRCIIYEIMSCRNAQVRFKLGLFHSRLRPKPIRRRRKDLIDSRTASTVRPRWYVHRYSPAISGQAQSSHPGIVDSLGAAPTQAVACPASSHVIPRQQIKQNYALSSAFPPPQITLTTIRTRTSIHKTIRCFSQRPPRERKTQSKT